MTWQMYTGVEGFGETFGECRQFVAGTGIISVEGEISNNGVLLEFCIQQPVYFAHKQLFVLQKRV